MNTKIDPNTPTVKWLRQMGACPESVEWAAQYPTLRDAWRACQSPDWMLWALKRAGFVDDGALRLYACRCVRETPLPDGRTVWDLLTEPSRKAVETAERFATGEATAEELAAAWDAAWDATGDATGDAARDAARAARAAARDTAWDAARAATRAAAWAATGDAVGDAARTAAGAAAATAQADILRDVVNPFPAEI